MQRQSARPDPALSFGSRPAPPAPPVVMPTHRTSEPEEPVPAFIPVVTRPALSPEARVEAPVAMGASTVTRWETPVPTYTYLAGAAGSGKTFLTKAWAEEEKGLLLCATTGIAAINLGGETINSILGYFDTPTMQQAYVDGFLTARLGRLWKAGVRRLILDEVSMLASDQLTYLVKAVEEVNGRGYVLGKWTDDESSPPPAMGLTLVGDFLQLPPVKAKYAFHSPEWKWFGDNILTLTEIRRQADPEFIAMLRAARQGRGRQVTEYFQDRGLIQQELDDHFDGPTIVARNEAVDRYNYLRMSALTGKEVRFTSSRWGKQRTEWTNNIPETLELKIGALVMILANERNALGQLMYVNGDLGTLVEATDRAALVKLQRTGEVVDVIPVLRQVKIPADGARRKELQAKGEHEKINGKWEILGEISYMPLRVAYASTVHKSQGLSLDKVQVNIRDRFFQTPGMLYVALSRARTAEGLRLVGSPQALVERCTMDAQLRGWL